MGESVLPDFLAEADGTVPIRLRPLGLTGGEAAERLIETGAALSLAAAFHALSQGVQVLRVHDVAESRHVVELWSAMVGGG